MIFIKDYLTFFKLKNTLKKKNIWVDLQFSFKDSFDLKKKFNTFLSTAHSNKYTNFADNANSILNKNLINISFVLSKIFIEKKHNINNMLLNLRTYCNIFLNNLKWIVTPLIISALYFYSSLFFIQIDFTKQIAVWFVVLVIFYILMSTFNNFLNKYKYGKFTSAIQRFWKRTGMTFWLIEGFLFLLFFYYFLNSSQEPLYMYDYSSLNQELLIQLKTSYKSLILISLAIYFSYILLLNNNYLNYYQNILLLSLISLIIIYTLYIESYQFVYVVSYYTDKNWAFDSNIQLWVLESEQNNIRVKQQYFILCLIAKYWHFIFIFISWVFFLIKSFEINKINYILLGYNVQNLLILYILNLFCLIQWLKWLTKKFLELTYYWFHIQYDEKLLNLLVSEVYSVIISMFKFNINSEFMTLQNYSNILYASNELSIWKYINCQLRIVSRIAKIT